jgi:hypothetical protein
MPAAEWSKKTAVEHQQDVFFTTKIGEADKLPIKISQVENGGWGIQLNFWHGFSSFGADRLFHLHSTGRLTLVEGCVF